MKTEKLQAYLKGADAKLKYHEERILFIEKLYNIDRADFETALDPLHYLNAMEEYKDKYATQSTQPTEKAVIVSVPTGKCIEMWYSQDKYQDDKFWKDAPFKTNGDVVEEIKTAVKYFLKNWQRVPLSTPTEQSEAVDVDKNGHNLNWSAETPNKYWKAYDADGTWCVFDGVIGALEFVIEEFKNNEEESIDDFVANVYPIYLSDEEVETMPEYNP